VTSVPVPRLREFMRLTFARVASVPRWGSPQWNWFWSFMVVEGALTAYLVAVLLTVLRLANGAEGIVSLPWMIWCVVGVAMFAAWSICHGLDDQEQTRDLRDRLAQAGGVARLRHSALGVGFVLGGVVCVGAASYFAAR
jgi:hypothetical protein